MTEGEPDGAGGHAAMTQQVGADQVEPGAMQAQGLVNLVAEGIRAKRCLALTARTTGNPALRGILVEKFETFVSMQYDPDLVGRPEGDWYGSLDQAAQQIAGLEPFDVAFVDPFHSYRSSIRALDIVARRVRPTGWIIVHDCLPPHALTTPRFVQGQWCGSTYAAFRDFAAQGERAWFVVDTDFGLGVLGPEGTKSRISDVAPAELLRDWSAADLEGRRELLRTDGATIMRALPVAVATNLLSRIFRSPAWRIHGPSG